MGLPDDILAAIHNTDHPHNRPFVTLSYAQSLDGSLAAKRGERTQISGSESARLTHILRANHDAILIGIGTLLIDNPQLTVRLVEGENPRPVVLDSKLQTPSDSFLVRSNPPWIATIKSTDDMYAQQLTSKGVKMFTLPANDAGQVSLPELMNVLHGEGIKSIMVEGGARVITGFLLAKLVDYLVLTISPQILGGVPSVQFDRWQNNNDFRVKGIRMGNYSIDKAGVDLVVFGRLEW
jgi:GTP cyclohydrolase II